MLLLCALFSNSLSEFDTQIKVSDTLHSRKKKKVHFKCSPKDIITDSSMEVYYNFNILLTQK